MVSGHQNKNRRRGHKHSHGGSSPASVSTPTPTPTTVASPTPTTVASPTPTTGVSPTPTTTQTAAPIEANSSDSSIMGNSLFQGISALVHFILSILAIYLSIKCNKGFNLGDFLLACCCPMCYVPIRLGISGFCQ